MNSKLCFALVVALLFASLAFAEDVGRFQLFTATLPDLDGQAKQCLLRIDTSTGKVSRYVVMNKPVELRNHPELKLMQVSGWVPVEEYADAERRAEAVLKQEREPEKKSSNP